MNGEEKRDQSPTDSTSRKEALSLEKKITSIVIRITIVTTALLGAWNVWNNIETFPRTDDAEVRANTVGISPQVGGTIVELPIVDNQRVKRGDLLMTLDARPYEAEEARAKARLELVRLEVEALQNQITEAKATLHDRQAKAAYSMAHYERLKPLLEGNFASADKVQQAQTEAESNQASVREAEAAVARASNLLGEVNGKNTRIEEAEAAFKDAMLKTSYCKVYAPCDGYITDLQIAPGAYAATGRQLFTIVDSSIWYVIANFREIDIHHIQRGQSARVYLMAQHRKPLIGVIQGIARGVVPLYGPSQSQVGEQGILSAVKPTFDFIQLATRFPVRIILQEVDQFDFRIGGKASVIIDTRITPHGGDLKLLQESEKLPFIPPVNKSLRDR